MGDKRNQSVIKEIFIAALLIVVIVIRFLPIGDDNTFIKSIGYIGVLVSLVDLYVDANRRYSTIDKFNVIKGWAYFLAIVLALVLGFLLTGLIPINSTWSDVFTLLALLISLPEKIYLIWIEKYLKKGK